MPPLPHPHGTAAGQIGNGANIDTGVTPGSALGKFVGFGEEGTSAIANRANWALSENIDSLHTGVSKDLAVPAGEAVASGHGDITKYQLTGDVFCGNMSYPADVYEGMNLLFSVLDANYDELIDGNGHEVRVGKVYDSSETTEQYRLGFATNPYMYFYANGVPYTIPNAQDLRIVYAEKSSLLDLPVDAFTRYKVSTAAEAPAGVLLQDGTRSMLGDLDLNGFSAKNTHSVEGKSAADLLISSAQDLLLSGSADIKFSDQYVTSVPLSQAGQTGVYDTGASSYPSIVGSLNSKTHVAQGLIQRGIAKGYGSTITIPGSGGSVGYGDTGVYSDGQFHLIPAGTLDLSGYAADTYYLKFSLSSSPALYAQTTLTQGDVVAYRIGWDGTNVTNNVPLAREFNGKVNTLELTVGYLDCDFGDGGLDLQRAIDHAVVIGASGGSAVVRIVGDVDVDNTVSLRGDVTILGDGYSNSRLLSLVEDNDHTFNCNGFSIKVEGVSIVQSNSNDLMEASTVFKNFGSYSTFRNLRVVPGTSSKRFSTVFSPKAVTSDFTVEGCVFEDIYAEDLTTAFLIGAVFTGSAFTSFPMRSTTVRNVYVTLSNLGGESTNPYSKYGVSLGGWGDHVENLTVISAASGLVSGWGLLMGPASHASGVTIDVGGYSTDSSGIVVFTDANWPASVVSNSSVSGVETGVVITQNGGATVGGRAKVVSTRSHGNGIGFYVSEGAVATFEQCITSYCTIIGFYADSSEMHIVSSRSFSQGKKHVVSDSVLYIDDSEFKDWNSDATTVDTTYGVSLLYGSKAMLRGCIFSSASSDNNDSSHVYAAGDSVLVRDCRFSNASPTQHIYGVRATHGRVSIIDNQFDKIRRAIHVKDVSDSVIRSNYVHNSEFESITVESSPRANISDNTIISTSEYATGIYVMSASDGSKVVGNTLKGVSGVSATTPSSLSAILSDTSTGVEIRGNYITSVGKPTSDASPYEYCGIQTRGEGAVISGNIIDTIYGDVSDSTLAYYIHVLAKATITNNTMRCNVAGGGEYGSVMKGVYLTTGAYYSVVSGNTVNFYGTVGTAPTDVIGVDSDASYTAINGNTVEILPAVSGAGARIALSVGGAYCSIVGNAVRNYIGWLASARTVIVGNTADGSQYHTPNTTEYPTSTDTITTGRGLFGELNTN